MGQGWDAYGSRFAQHLLKRALLQQPRLLMEKTDDLPAYIVPSYGIGLRTQSTIRSSQGEMTDRTDLPIAA